MKRTISFKYEKKSYFNAQKQLLSYRILQFQALVYILLFSGAWFIVLFFSPPVTFRENWHIDNFNLDSTVILLLIPLLLIITFTKRRKHIQKYYKMNKDIGEVTYSITDKFFEINSENGEIMKYKWFRMEKFTETDDYYFIKPKFDNKMIYIPKNAKGIEKFVASLEKKVRKHSPKIRFSFGT